MRTTATDRPHHWPEPGIKTFVVAFDKLRETILECTPTEEKVLKGGLFVTHNSSRDSSPELVTAIQPYLWKDFSKNGGLKLAKRFNRSYD